MIKYSRWKVCEGVGGNTKNTGRWCNGLKTMKWDEKSRHLREVRLVKTSGEREERWLESRTEGGKKWNEETREWTQEIIQDFSRKWDHQTHHHQETQWSLSSSICWRSDWWSGREWKGGKMKESARNRGHWKDQIGGRQDCWIRDRREKDDERNGWNEESLKIKNIEKTR